MKCPHCDGKGGFFDYWGEYDECSVCKETGIVTVEQASEYHANLDRIDKEIAKERAAIEAAKEKK